MEPTLNITLCKSPIGRLPKHRATLRALGLKRIGQTIQKQATPSIKGMIAHVGYLISVQQAGV